ncbi:hypothetical protein [Shimia thalassica]|nr:hypothetical protein [Shimia thalassica]MDO6485929.1 hypothetical protein [Shimia thalassica]
MPTTACAKDFHRLFKQHLPEMFYNYIEYSSYTVSMFLGNETVFE